MITGPCRGSEVSPPPRQRANHQRPMGDGGGSGLQPVSPLRRPLQSLPFAFSGFHHARSGSEALRVRILVFAWCVMWQDASLTPGPSRRARRPGAAPFTRGTFSPFRPRPRPPAPGSRAPGICGRAGCRSRAAKPRRMHLAATEWSPSPNLSSRPAVCGPGAEDACSRPQARRQHRPQIGRRCDWLLLWRSIDAGRFSLRRAAGSCVPAP